MAQIAAAVALLDRGYGKPVTDDEGREHLNITIRKILEITARETNGATVIEHDDRENVQRENLLDGDQSVQHSTEGNGHDRSDDSEPER